MAQRVLATIVTTTSYGTWPPGDLRGYVEKGQILPGDPTRLAHAKSLMSAEPVYFDPAQQLILWTSLTRACEEFGYVLTDASVESWHLHWIVDHGFDPVDDMVGRLKTRMRQALYRGRVWTEGYCHRCMETHSDIAVARRYVRRHAGCRLSEGRIVTRG
jgi:hypothetical protein